MQVEKIDHLVLTVADIDKTVSFYTTVLGMQAVTFGEGRTALKFGVQKINLHPLGNEFEPKASHAVPGSADLCLITALPIDKALLHLKRHHVSIIDGPVERTGAEGVITSIYFNDPDGNLIEISNYL